DAGARWSVLHAVVLRDQDHGDRGSEADREPSHAGGFSAASLPNGTSSSRRSGAPATSNATLAASLATERRRVVDATREWLVGLKGEYPFIEPSCRLSSSEATASSRSAAAERTSGARATTESSAARQSAAMSARRAASFCPPIRTGASRRWRS